MSNTDGASRKAEIISALKEMAGTPAQMAAALGVEASDATFRRALDDLSRNGTLLARGSTRDRHYINTAGLDEQSRALLAVVPCTAREFSDHGHKLGLKGEALGALKLRLGIETFKGEDGRWHCRQVEGYTGPEGEAPRERAGLTTDSGYTDSEKFAPMATRAAKDRVTIGGKAKTSKDTD